VLTPAEWRTVHAVKHGLSSRQIAERRGISIDAVKYHVANALAKLGLANRRELRHWHRAPNGSALKEASEIKEAGEIKEEGMNTSIEKTPLKLGVIGQIARTVRDIKQSEAWYAHTVGLPHLFTFGKLAFFDCNGIRLMLSEESAAAAESILYWRVEGIARAHETLKSRGVEFINAPHLIHQHADGTEEWLAMFKDPEGRPLGLISQVRPALPVQ
jgi:DNA-binding CsgD family transcriptional regulator